MDKKVIFAFVFMLLCRLTAWADIVPTAYYTIDGEEQETTDYITDAEAPLSVRFQANPSDMGEAVPSFEWRFFKEGQTDPFLVRYEENTNYEFRESGTTTVSLYVSYGADEEPGLVGSIRVTISTSLLEVPNAFSPNGDGINDVFRVKSNHKSIVEFHAYICNRWGQQLYDWTSLDGGWDGTYHGSPVKAGVYFVLVKAKGADGRTYHIRRDVNILRDYIESTSPTQ